MVQKESIYFIAIIPPEEIIESITAFRMDFAIRFQSRAALKVIPHITLKAPFKLMPADQPKLAGWFQSLSFDTGPFEVELKDFGYFNKRQPVVFVKPVLNEALSAVQKQLIRSFQTAFPEIDVTAHELKFHPHITIAYRDLSFANFQEAWKEYETKQYRAVFGCGSIALLQHNGTKWNVVETVEVKQPYL